MNITEKVISIALKMINYGMKLISIDPYLATCYLPINESIKKAIEIVISYFSYRKKRA